MISTDFVFGFSIGLLFAAAVIWFAVLRPVLRFRRSVNRAMWPEK